MNNRNVTVEKLYGVTYDCQSMHRVRHRIPYVSTQTRRHPKKLAQTLLLLCFSKQTPLFVCVLHSAKSISVQIHLFCCKTITRAESKMLYRCTGIIFPCFSAPTVAQVSQVKTIILRTSQFVSDINLRRSYSICTFQKNI